MTRRWALHALAASLALAACDAALDPVAPAAPALPADAPEGAFDPRFLTLIDTSTLRITEPDPFPGAKGYWLGSGVTPGKCYAWHNAAVVDRDKDWLDDDCEYQIALAFRPHLYMSAWDECPNGEPYWAAMVFDEGMWGPNTTVRIAYMPSYYRDCGAAGLTAHIGDSEQIMLQVGWDHGTRHWVLQGSFLSAHDGTVTEASTENQWQDMFYPDGSQTRRSPKVFVARNKHGNYRSEASCEWGAVATDSCVENFVGRLEVLRHRNVGSHNVDFFPGCVASEESYLTGRECYYTKKRFFGWGEYLAIGQSGAPPYHDFLHGGNFGIMYFWTAGPFPLQIINKGHGPYPPAALEPFSWIGGPGQAAGYTTQSWQARTDGSPAPPRYEWRRLDHDPVLGYAWQLVSTSGSYTAYVNQCEDFDLEMKTIYTVVGAWEETYVYADTLRVDVAPCSPPFVAYIDGPSYGNSGQPLTYEAVAYGSYGHRYEWWLRDNSHSARLIGAQLVGTGPTLVIEGPWENTTMDLVLLVFDAQNRRVRSQRSIRISYVDPGDGSGGGTFVPVR